MPGLLLHTVSRRIVAIPSVAEARRLKRAIEALQDSRKSEFQEVMDAEQDVLIAQIVPSMRLLRSELKKQVSNTTWGTSGEILLSATMAVLGTCGFVWLARWLSGGAVPPLYAASAEVALATYLVFVLVGHVWWVNGAGTSTPWAVLRGIGTGYVPWMGDRVVSLASRSWAMGVRGIYVPREGREFYEPYADMIPYSEIMSAAERISTDGTSSLAVVMKDGRMIEFREAVPRTGGNTAEIAVMIEGRLTRP